MASSPTPASASTTSSCTGIKERTTSRSLTVLVDSREKTPLLFPKVFTGYTDRSASTAYRLKVSTHRQALGYGDYCLRGDASHCCIERKGSLLELHNNLFSKDYQRFTDALDRLHSGCQNPYLLLDFPLEQTGVTTERVPRPDLVMDALYSELVPRNIRVLWAGPTRSVRSRVLLGENLLRIMLVHRRLQKVSKNLKKTLDPTPALATLGESNEA